jgi:hypothetical protein
VPLQNVPVDEVIPTRWRSSVIDDDGRVNRISYELCVLTLLRDRLRSKEIWVGGADRYRNPDDDLPKDFEIRRDAYIRDSYSLPLMAQSGSRVARRPNRNSLRSISCERFCALTATRLVYGPHPHVSSRQS